MMVRRSKTWAHAVDTEQTGLEHLYNGMDEQMDAETHSKWMYKRPTAAVLPLACNVEQHSDQQVLHPFAHAVHMLQQQHRLIVTL